MNLPQNIIICTKELIFSKTTRFLYCSLERSLKIACSLFCSKICENGRDNTSVQSRTRSYRFSSRRATARRRERSQRIPYFTNSENPFRRLSYCSFFYLCKFTVFFFFFLSFFGGTTKKWLKWSFLLFSYNPVLNKLL